MRLIPRRARNNRKNKKLVILSLSKDQFGCSEGQGEGIYFFLHTCPVFLYPFRMALVLTRQLQPLRGLVDLVPIVTVVLLLLSFFLLSSSFVLQSGIKVDPPRSTSGVGSPASRLIVAVTLAPPQVDANGAPLKREPILYFNDQVLDMNGLRAALDKLPANRVSPSLVLKADKDVPLDVVSNIMDTAFAHRLSVIVATQPAAGTPSP